MLNDALRGALLRASRSAQLRSVVENAPVSRSVVRRFVAGHSAADAVRVSGVEGTTLVVGRGGAD